MTHWSDETSWQRLSDVAARIKARAEAAYVAGRDDEADAAHDDLVSVEHRMRMAERRARRA
jgi:hypothetical protein